MWIFLILATATWVATAIGAGVAVFFGKEQGRMYRAVLGFAAGIMLVAGFFELLAPALEAAALYVVVIGFLVGCFGIMALDAAMGHRGEGAKYKKSSVLAGAISIHNLPVRI